MDNFLKTYIDKLNDYFLNPDLELRILLNKSKKINKDIIFSNFNINDIDIDKFKIFYNRRINREPISKIFNEKSFWKYDFFVNKDVLDPRPETELIIEKILQFYSDKLKQLKILDLCTGSGCLAISIAKEYPNAIITATDLSKKALKVAKLNSVKFNCSDNIKFENCDLIKKIEKYDIVISNPPYLSELDYKNTSLEIQLYEPKLALVASDNGLEFYKKIAYLLPKLLKQSSLAFIEIGSNQASSVKDIFKINNLKCIKIAKDIQNLNRLMILKKS